MKEFFLGNVLDAVVSQVMLPLRERKLQLFHEIPEEMKKLTLYGDQIRLQLVLSDFLLNVVHHTPPDGWVEINISPGLKLLQDGNEFIRMQLRYSYFPYPDVMLSFLYLSSSLTLTVRCFCLFTCAELHTRVKASLCLLYRTCLKKGTNGVPRKDSV